MSTLRIRLAAGVAALSLLGLAQQKIPPGIGKGWLGEFDHAVTQVNDEKRTRTPRAFCCESSCTITSTWDSRSPTPGWSA
jgi:hypothetical protein